MAKIVGSVVDSDSGDAVPARVRVVGSTGQFIRPDGAILKVGTGDPFFYSDGSFTVDAPRGPARIVVERGTEYVPATLELDVPSRGTVEAEVNLERWTDLGDRGWHPGNTHIHYDEKETRPDERLRLDPRIEDLRMTAVSILKRWDLEYATNAYPPGMLTEFSSAHHYVQCGEENRHNFDAWGPSGYGHVMLLNIRNVVEPVSRGLLVDAFDPDYPPLSYACDDAHRQGGIVIWCHNGQGMEAPVAAALGKLDAFNLFDPNWMDVEYDIYYRMLNAGFRLPVSTGSDWYICSANRVYAYTGKKFEYPDWLEALKLGRTFITNGPSLSLEAAGMGPGAEIDATPGEHVSVLATWQSHYPINRAEVVFNGLVLAAEVHPDGSREGRVEVDLPIASDGWIAARLSSTTRDSFAQPIFAHTSPVYVRTGLSSPERANAARTFSDGIDRDIERIRARGKFYSDAQRLEIEDLFRQGGQVYQNMLR